MKNPHDIPAMKGCTNTSVYCWFLGLPVDFHPNGNQVPSGSPGRYTMLSPCYPKHTQYVTPICARKLLCPDIDLIGLIEQVLMLGSVDEQLVKDTLL